MMNPWISKSKLNFDAAIELASRLPPLNHYNGNGVCSNTSYLARKSPLKASCYHLTSNTFLISHSISFSESIIAFPQRLLEEEPTSC